MAKCKACGAEIKWVEMDPSGKPMPVDPAPLSVVLSIKDMPYDLIDKELSSRKYNRAVVVRAYQPHWASCPAADQFRKRG